MTYETIIYNTKQTLRKSEDIDGLGRKITGIGNDMNDDSARISSAWTGGNSTRYCKKQHQVALKVTRLGQKISMISGAMKFSAETIIAADKVAKGIIKAL